MSDTRSPILITGATGQVGFELVRALHGLAPIVALDRAGLDLADNDQIRRVVRSLAPSAIVNAAAYTAVDRAEQEQSLARQINAVAPGVLAEEAKRIGAPLIHYSTDYVFDGTLERPYRESDPVNPLNEYGRSKAEGEQAIAAVGGAHLILRTSWVYGLRGSNFLLTMLRLARERDQLRIVADQHGAPTWSGTIAAATAHVLAQMPRTGRDEWWAAHGGTYHLTASGATSWHGFASAIFDIMGNSRRPEVVPISSSEYRTAAQRPLNSRLSTEKLFDTFGYLAPDWQDCLRIVTRIQDEYCAKVK